MVFVSATGHEFPVTEVGIIRNASIRLPTGTVWVIRRMKVFLTDGEYPEELLVGRTTLEDYGMLPEQQTPQEKRDN
jgi:hypothetical protein